MQVALARLNPGFGDCGGGGAASTDLLRVRDEPHADVLQAKARDWGMFVGRALVAWPPARFGGSSGVPGSVGRVGRDPPVILRAKRVRVGCRRRDRSGRAAQ